MNIYLKIIQDCQEHNDLAVRLLNENREYLYNDLLVTIESHRQFLASHKRQMEYLWIIEKDDVPCGMVSIYNIDVHNRKCEWGRFMIDRKVRGIGRVVEYMILEFVFNELNMNKLYCEVLLGNGTVINLHKKFGFQMEGIYKDHVMKQGIFYTAVMLAIRKEEWERQRNHFNQIYNSYSFHVDTKR